MLVLLQILDEVSAAGGPAGGATRAQLAADLRAAVTFLRDDPNGLEAVWSAIRSRRR